VSYMAARGAVTSEYLIKFIDRAVGFIGTF
jgi:hypothetical protein